jgi:hypothetical protein
MFMPTSVRRARSLALLGVVALALSPWRSARAQSATDGARLAFERGIAAEEQGLAAEACLAFRESLRLVRELGPLRKVAACDEREGKLLRAAEQLREVLERLPADDAERAVTQSLLKSVESRLGRLSLKRRPGAPAGMHASIDGLDRALPSSGLLLEPGVKDLVVSIPGEPSRVVEVTISSGQDVTVELPPPADAKRGAPAPSVARPAPRGATMRTAGFVVGGIGVASLVSAGITGLKLLDEKSELDACAAEPGCDTTPIAQRANPLVVVNAIAWGVGVVGVGTGVTLLVLDAQESGDPTVEAEVGLGGVHVGGSF